MQTLRNIISKPCTLCGKNSTNKYKHNIMPIDFSNHNWNHKNCKSVCFICFSLWCNSLNLILHQMMCIYNNFCDIKIQKEDVDALIVRLSNN